MASKIIFLAFSLRPAVIQWFADLMFVLVGRWARAGVRFPTAECGWA
jgi:hypothetical protein